MMWACSACGVFVPIRHHISHLLNFAGVRVLGSEKHELLRQVPKSLVDIFKIGSTAPGGHLPLSFSLVHCTALPKCYKTVALEERKGVGRLSDAVGVVRSRPTEQERLQIRLHVCKVLC